MSREQMLEILEKIRNLVNMDSKDLAKEYIRMEIDNLTGATEERCKSTKYHYYPTYCKWCENFNCESNINKDIV